MRTNLQEFIVSSVINDYKKKGIMRSVSNYCHILHTRKQMYTYTGYLITDHEVGILFEINNVSTTHEVTSYFPLSCS